MNNYLVEAIKSLCPSAEFVITADDYSTIVWHKIEGDAPTLAKVEAEIKRLQDLELTAESRKAEAKASAQSKLEALGLTVEEIAALSA
jgi:hypothetical protein